MIHTLLHITGIDTQQSRWYDFWSGIATQASLLGGLAAFYRRSQCHQPWCVRLGHPHPAMNHQPVCRKHAHTLTDAGNGGGHVKVQTPGVP